MSSRQESDEETTSDEVDDLDDIDEETDSDTEDADEIRSNKSEEHVEIKDQWFHDQLTNLKWQLKMLKEGTHPEFLKKNQLLIENHQKTLALIEVTKQCMIERVERDFVNEMKSAAKEYEEKKIDLRENLIQEFEEKKKLIEAERQTLDLNPDNSEYKPQMTRKLRRRPNEPLPQPEKRRKPPPAQIVSSLEEKDIEADLRSIGKMNHNSQSTSRASTSGLSIKSPTPDSSEPRIEDGKLKFEKRFFHRGQPVYVEGKHVTRFAGNIHNIGTDNVVVKKLADSSKFRICLSQLAKRKIKIERRVP